jgi:hypothetical protein
VKKATKRELIVVATMISRMIGTPVFSDRTRFSVSTPVESFPSLPCLRGSAEKNAHNLATEILTILFPPPKHPWIGE